MLSGSGKARTISRERALDLATDALIFIAGDANRMAKFLGHTGYRPEQIRAQANAPDFLAGILGFLLDDESMLLAFAANGNHDPSTLSRAHHVLSGTGSDQGTSIS
ncbi:MAG TPA: DUF3572 domain-containing protein [Hyphomicrobiales bacterium]|nr:DUF3572 domain-containing protein [Hyphomicrobiales bacterium]